MYNLQGDVVGILDESGALVVEYKYDAWGKLLGTTGSLAGTIGKFNPLRYRGYVYDEETGLYYLKSRYYNPEWGRFINADVVLGQVGVFGSHNMYAYCKNSPAILVDRNGYSPEIVPHPSRPDNWDTAFRARMFAKGLMSALKRAPRTLAKAVGIVSSTVNGYIEDTFLVGKAMKLNQHGGGVINFKTGMKATCYTAEYWNSIEENPWGRWCVDGGLMALGKVPKIGTCIELIGAAMWVRDGFILWQNDQIRDYMGSDGSIGWISWERSSNHAPMPTAWNAHFFTPIEWFGEIESVEFFD